MNNDQRSEYAEALGLALLADVAPLDVREYGVLADAVRSIVAARLVLDGVSEDDAKSILDIADDCLAFATLVRL